MNQVVQPPPMSPSPHPTYAGFWKRFAAVIIDEIILGIAILIVFVPMILVLGVGAVSREDFEPSPELLIGLIGAYMIFVVVGLLAKWLYYAIMESLKGATIGKMALGIKVTDLNGQQISFGRATGRYFGKILSGLTLCIGYIIAGFSQQKQALHDMLAKTLVVNKY
jgi:uncharacterized RDD family membrane protein YckC